METLYGTDAFRVALRTIPQQSAISPENGKGKCQWLVVSGNLDLTAPAGRQSLGVGQYAENPEALENRGNTPAHALEIAWQAEHPRQDLHEITETRPWGSFTVLKDEPTYKLKQLRVTPGNRLSLQRHQKREEHWLVVAGHPQVTLDDRVLTLAPGDYIHIPLQAWHRITNPKDAGEDVEIIELQLGSYFGEDDIERSEDDYGRKGLNT